MNRKRTNFTWESLFLDGDGRAFSLREEPELADYKTPLSELQRGEAIGAVRSFIRALPPRTRGIIERRYGLYDPPETLTRIGRRYGVSKQRISQLEAAAFKELRLLIENRSAQHET